jgi:hypothetical protein
MLADDDDAGKISYLETAHRCRTTMEMDLGIEQLLAVELDSVRDTNVAHGTARAVERIACIIDSCVPTHSSTASAPIPFVSSLMRATASSPRSVTMSVAPNSRASFCRGS